MRQLKRSGNRWCEIEIEHKDGCLSICGSEGRIVKTAAARKEAREYWESFFEESPEELSNMRRLYGKTTPKSAAKYVLESDGELHGLDVHKENENAVYLTEGCGQIVEDLKKWFPEYADLLPYHLNDMHAECEHQAARGEAWKTHAEAICPDCGYKLGSAWLSRPLPDWVISKLEAIHA